MGIIRWFFKHFNSTILLILLLGFFLRVWMIGEVPKGITHDEMGYIYNAYSIATTGKNIFGESFPFLTWMTPGGFPFMPGTIYGMVPVFWLFPLTPAIGRLPAALLGTCDIFLLYLLVNNLFKKKNIAFLSALFLAISPWHLHFSRSAYDPNFALFFYLLGILLFLYEIEKKKLPIFSIVFILLGIYSYRGMSIIAFPLLLLLFGYGAFILKASKKQLVIFGLGIGLILLSLIVVTMSVGKAYTAEGQVIFTNPKIQENIDNKIREADGPLSLKRAFINKPTYIIDSIRENYILSYSPEYLFLYTEPSQIYAIWSRGRLYFIDLFFIILGLYYVVRFYPRQAWLVVGLLIIGGLPGGIGGMPFSARNYFLSAIFPVVTALGVVNIFSWRLPKKILILLGIVIVSAYMYAMASYLFDYYYRYANQGAESWAYSLRQVTDIINKNENSDKKIVVVPVSLGDVAEYGLHTGIKASEIQKVMAEKSVSKSGEFYKYKNILFLSDCKDLETTDNSIIITRGDCLKEATSSSYIRDFYRNIIWRIYK